MSEQTSLVVAEAHIKERAARAFHLGELYEEEGFGLLWAISSRKPLHWSKDPERQSRFLKGFADGCEILRLAVLTAAVDKDLMLFGQIVNRHGLQPCEKGCLWCRLG